MLLLFDFHWFVIGAFLTTLSFVHTQVLGSVAETTGAAVAPSARPTYKSNCRCRSKISIGVCACVCLLFMCVSLSLFFALPAFCAFLWLSTRLYLCVIRACLSSYVSFCFHVSLSCVQLCVFSCLHLSFNPNWIFSHENRAGDGAIASFVCVRVCDVCVNNHTRQTRIFIHFFFSFSVCLFVLLCFVCFRHNSFPCVSPVYLWS